MTLNIWHRITLLITTINNLLDWTIAASRTMWATPSVKRVICNAAGNIMMAASVIYMGLILLAVNEIGLEWTTAVWPFSHLIIDSHTSVIVASFYYELAHMAGAGIVILLAHTGRGLAQTPMQHQSIIATLISAAFLVAATLSNHAIATVYSNSLGGAAPFSLPIEQPTLWLVITTFYFLRASKVPKKFEPNPDNA